MEDQNKFKKPIGYIGDKYILQLDLSYGGEGFVYKVKEKETNNIYAAKISRNDGEDFENEIFYLTKLKKDKRENIINFITSGEDNIKRQNYEEKVKYIILDLAQNYDLGGYILHIKQGFEESHCKVIFYKMLKCIESVHKSGICHRDIKLDNFLLDSEFNPKIGDFGHATYYNSNLTDNCGTEGYKAPEIEANEPYDGYEIDIFSLGICLLELISGKYLINQKEKKNKYFEPIQNRDKKSFWDLLEANSHKKFSDELKNLCFGMISIKPEERPKMKDLLNHNWFGNIPKMNDKDLEKHKNEIKLKEEFERRSPEVIENTKEDFKSEYNDYLTEKKTKAFDDKEGDYFNNDVNVVSIKSIYFQKFYILIKCDLHPVNFINSLCKKIIKKFGKDNCDIKADKNELKFDLIFYDEEDNESIMQAILYQTTEGYVLRFLRKNMDRKDFFDKFKNIADLLKENIFEG